MPGRREASQGSPAGRTQGGSFVDRPTAPGAASRRPGASAPEALANTIALAQLAERLGYTRYWLAEHHNTRGLAGSAPEVLVARVASATQTIRVGAGGVMLPHYSPLKV